MGRELAGPVTVLIFAGWGVVALSAILNAVASLKRAKREAATAEGERPGPATNAPAAVIQPPGPWTDPQWLWWLWN